MQKAKSKKQKAKSQKQEEISFLLSAITRQTSMAARWSSVIGFTFLFFTLFSSCTSTKKTIYFRDIPKDTTLTNLVSKNFEPKIQKADLLSIHTSVDLLACSLTL